MARGARDFQGDTRDAAGPAQSTVRRVRQAALGAVRSEVSGRATRDAFGRPIVAPAELGRVERVDLLRQAAEALAAGRSPSPYVARYLADALEAWLHDGGDLEHVLGVRPPRGSRKRPETLIRQAERDRLIVSFAARAGSDRAAALVLRGEQPCPPELAPVRATLQAQRAPMSASGIWKARRRASSHRG